MAFLGPPSCVVPWCGLLHAPFSARIQAYYTPLGPVMLQGEPSLHQGSPLQGQVVILIRGCSPHLSPVVHDEGILLGGQDRCTHLDVSSFPLPRDPVLRLRDHLITRSRDHPITR